MSTKIFSDPSGSIQSVARDAGDLVAIAQLAANIGMKNVKELKDSIKGLPPDANYYLYKLPTEELNKMKLVDRIRFVDEAKRKEEQEAFEYRMNEIRKIDEERKKKREEESNKKWEEYLKQKEAQKKAKEAYNNSPQRKVEMLEKDINRRDSDCQSYLMGMARNGADQYAIREASDRCNEERKVWVERLQQCKLNIRNYEDSIKNNNKPIPFICGGSKTIRRRHSKKTATRKSRRHHKKSKKTRKH